MVGNFTCSVQGWPTSPTGLPYESFRTRLKATVVSAFLRRDGMGIEITSTPFFKNSNLQKKTRLNNKLVGRTELDKKKRNIGLLIAVLKLMRYNL